MILRCIVGVMVSLLAMRAVDRVFEPRSGQTKDYAIEEKEQRLVGLISG